MTQPAQAIEELEHAAPFCEITLEHPDGRMRLRAPSDVPLNELLGDLLDVAGQPDRDDWTLVASDGRPHPAGMTLDELGMTDGGVLMLHAGELAPSARRAGDALALVPATPPAGVPSAPTSAELERLRGQRPVSTRTAATLPTQLSGLERIAVVARALVTRTPLRTAPTPRASGIPDPATFTLPARISPLARMGQAWALSDFEALLDQQILAPRLSRCVTIAVVSPKGGVGKTTTTALLGSLLAHLRRDRVVAVDTNPDFGTLGRRLVPGHPVFIDDLLADGLGEGRLSPTELDTRLGRGPDGLMVAPAPTEPERARALSREDYATLFARLSELVGALVLDCGTGLDRPAAEAAMACADQLVLVADGEPDTASLVAEAAQHLDPDGPSLLLVVNNLNRSSRVDVDALERAIASARGIVRVPTSQPGVQRLHGSHFTWKEPVNAWMTPIRELAALLAADWRRQEIAK